MDYVTMATLALGGAVTAGFLGYRGWQRETEMRYTPPSADHDFLLVDGMRAMLNGQRIEAGNFISSCGSFGGNMILKYMKRLVANAHQDTVRSFCVAECNDSMWQNFEKAVPTEFRDLLVRASAAIEGGFTNRTVQEVMAIAEKWLKEIEQATEDACYQHRSLSYGRGATHGIHFQSLGGHTALSLPMIEVIHRHYSEMQIMAFTSLPKDTPLRKNFAEIAPLLKEYGLSGWVVADDSDEKREIKDKAMLDIVLGLEESALANEQQNTQANNAYHQLLNGAQGGMIVYRVASGDVYAEAHEHQPHYDKGMRFIVSKTQAANEVLTQLAKVDAGGGVWSVNNIPVRDIPAGKVVDLITLALPRRAVRAVKKIVNEKLQTTQRFKSHYQAARLYGQPNYEMRFASLSTPITNPVMPMCPVSVIRLIGVANGEQNEMYQEIARLSNQRTTQLDLFGNPTGRAMKGATYARAQ